MCRRLALSVVEVSACGRYLIRDCLFWVGLFREGATEAGVGIRIRRTVPVAIIGTKVIIAAYPAPHFYMPPKDSADGKHCHIARNNVFPYCKKKIAPAYGGWRKETNCFSFSAFQNPEFQNYGEREQRKPMVPLAFVGSLLPR